MFGLGQLGKLGSVGRAIAAWTPAKLWPLGASSPGLWIDPPYTASLFSTSTGTTAISAIGTVLDSANPVGLALDRKGNLALGPELVTNGGPFVGASWTLGTGVTISGGVLIYTSAVYFENAYQAIGAAAGKIYQVSIVIDSISSGALKTLWPGESAELSAPGTYTFRVVGAGDSRVGLFAIGVTTATVSSISVKEIPGIHLSQATSTSRPVASARKNELVGTAALATQNVTSKALQYVLSFWGTGSVTLSGTSTAGPLAGTGAGDRVSLTFTPTAGTLTLTVSGTATNAQLEVVG